MANRIATYARAGEAFTPLFIRASRLQSMTRDLGASIAIDETTRERAAYMCADFVRHEGVAIPGRQGRFDVFALPLG